MAFVSQSERALGPPQPQTAAIGPGAYNPDSFKDSRSNNAYAPFLSTSRKTSVIHPPSRNIAPGPGDYEIGTRIVEPVIQTLSNSHSIIVKINSTGTAPFKSSNNRFAQKANQVPGPGSYIDLSTMRNSAPTTNRTRSLTAQGIQEENHSPTTRAIEQIRDLNRRRKNPTIPNRITSLSNTNRQHSQNQSNTVPLNQQLHEEKQKLIKQLGPGKYNIEDGFGKHAKDTVWGKDKVERFNQKQDPTHLGPGKYNPNLAGKQPEYKYNPSFSFVSDTVRTHFDTMCYRTNQSFKAKIRMKSHYKAPEPGPGHYDTHISAIELKTTPFDFQSFGSRVQRFEDPALNNSTGGLYSPVGPGQYKLPSDFQRATGYNKAALSFNSSSYRDSSFLETGALKSPGPGAYTEQLILEQKDNKKGFKRKSVEQFGVTEQRFVLNREQVLKPGPGAYLDPEINPRHSSLSGRETAVSSGFVSATGRNPFGDNRGEGVPVGSYDLKAYDVASKIEKQRTFIQNLKKIDVEKAPFDSSHSRFAHYENKPKTQKQKQEEEKAKSGNVSQLVSAKGSPKHNDVFNSDFSPKSYSGPAFMAREKRFADNKRGAPSVGVYQLKSQWTKPTYNVKYQKGSSSNAGSRKNSVENLKK